MLKFSLIVALLALVALGEAKRRVCVVGTGPAGLTATKFLAEHPDEFETVTFEKASDVGGIWIYTDSQTTDEHGLPVHSSAYKYLRVNVPKELLEFPSYRGEFKGENVSFVRHTDVHQYLRNYTEHFNLRQYIKFNTNVEKVEPLAEGKWRIVAKDLNSQEVKEEICDATMLANGHLVKGSIPKITGIETFTGQVLHSHVYRKPEDFANKTVLVLGASYSGQEIASQSSHFATKVYLSHRNARLNITFRPNVEQVLGVTGADGDYVILSDGKRLKVDVMIYATGFVFDFPFLDETSGLKVVKGKHVQWLYKHMINIEHPTMAVMNVPYPRLAFIEAHAQSAYFIAVLLNKVQLPEREAMLKASELPAEVPTSKAHYVNKEVFDYYDDLAAAAGYPILPLWFRTASDETTARIFADPLHFREYNLVVDHIANNREATYRWVGHTHVMPNYLS